VLLFAILGVTPVLGGVNSWTATGPAGLVYALAADPVISGTLYASTDQGTFRSLDHGATWSSYPSTPEGLPPYAFAIDPFARGSLVAGSNHLYRTTDDGASWVEVTPPTYNGLITPTLLQFDTHVPGRLYAGQQGSGVFRSDDAGASWVAFDASLGLATAFAIDPADSSRLFLGTELGDVYRSLDTGATWTKVERPGFGFFLLRLAFVGAGQRALMSVSDSDMWETFNAGQSWLPSRIPGVAALPSSLAVDPAHPANLFVTAGPPASPPEIPPPIPPAVFRSTDGGVVWTPLIAGLPDYPTITSLVADSTGTYVHGIAQTGTWSFQILGGASTTIPTLSPVLLISLAVALAIAGALAVRRASA
jgi:photosystem II stability/assembly factor-like uncharacterized protein